MASSYRLGLTQAISYSLPAATIYFLFGPIVVLQGIYSKYFGLSLTSIAAAIFFVNIVDAATDPVAGYIFDRYHVRSGKRKPLILISAVSFLLSCYFLYCPPYGVSIFYFIFWYSFAYLSLKFFDIPHLAWPHDLSSDFKVRTKLYGLRSLAIFFGSLLFFGLPQLPIFSTTEITPGTLRWAVGIATILLFFTLYFCLMYVPEKSDVSNALADDDLSKGLSPFQLIFLNKPLLLFLLAILFSGFGVGMWGAIFYIYIDSYLNLGDKFSLVYVLGLALSMLALGAWYKFSNRFGNIVTWFLGVALMAVGIFFFGYLKPETGRFYNLFFVIAIFNIGSASHNIMAPSFLGKIVDYGNHRFGGDHAAFYFSVFTMVTKMNFALGSAAALGLAGWYGFDPASASGHSVEAVWSLKLAVAWIPTSSILIALMVIWHLPLNDRRHAIIMKRLDRQKRRKSISCPGESGG